MIRTRDEFDRLLVAYFAAELDLRKELELDPDTIERFRELRDRMLRNMIDGDLLSASVAEGFLTDRVDPRRRR